jgi:uncharacterized cupin superfamily protein
VRRVNLREPVYDRSSEREGYRWRAAKVGAQLGAQKIGGTLYELDGGERTFPYHLHHGMEEWLIVLAGAPTLRAPEGERVLRLGEVVCFPPGPTGAHQVRGPGRVLLLSASRTPETIEYLDSGKLGAGPPGRIFRMDDAVDYWEGE